MPLPEEINRVKTFLCSLLTDSVLEEIPLTVYRQELPSAIAGLIGTCATTSDAGTATITHLDEVRLRDFLYTIDWCAICTNYDMIWQGKSKHGPSTEQKSQKITILDELLTCFQNPCIWPEAGNAILAEVLLFHIVQDGGKHHSSHRPTAWKRLLVYVIVLFHRQPALQHHFHSLLQNSLVGQGENQFNAQMVNSMLIIIPELISEFPRRRLSLLMVLLDILCIIDSRSHHHQATLSRAQTKHVEDIHNQEKRRRRRTIGLARLHGEVSDDDDEGNDHQTLCFRNRIYRTRAGSMNRQLTFKADTTILSYEQAKLELERLQLVRIKTMQIYFDNCRDLVASATPETVMTILLQDLLTVASNNQSPTHTLHVRLCGFLLGHMGVSTDPEFMPLLMQMIWSRVHERYYYLSWYVELLIESAYFDDDTKLWSAVKPLYETLKAYTDRHIEDLSTPTKAFSPRARPFLQCLSFLVRYRGAMLRQKSEFSLLLVQLSNVVEWPELWIPATISSTERQKLLLALQATGMFGVHASRPRVADDNGSATADASEWYTTWFLDPSIGSTIRQGRYCLSMIPIVNAECFFSSYSLHNKDPLAREPCRNPHQRDGRSKLLPLPGDCHVNDDIVRHVLSFLGYKRLLRMRLVCQGWKQFVDNDVEMWMPLYCKRFGWKLTSETPLGKSGSLPWKKLFMDRWMVERQVRFERTATGWKKRVCNHLGCLKILTSPQRQQQHQAYHARQLEKRKDSNKISRKRQRDVGLPKPSMGKEVCHTE